MTTKGHCETLRRSFFLCLFRKGKHWLTRCLHDDLIVAKHCSSFSKVQSRTNGPNKPFLYSSTQCRSHLSSPTKSGWSSSECTCSWCWLSLSFSQLIFGTTSVREQHSRNIQIDTLTSHTFRQAISARTSTLFHHQKRTISSSFTIS